jgi:hypothetical protein
MNEAVVADMVVAGFKNIVLMGDHGGGQKQLEELADSLNAKYSPEGVHVLYCGAAYTKARDDFDAILKEKKLPVSNHAGLRVYVSGRGRLWQHGCHQGVPEFAGDLIGDTARNKCVASQHRVWPSLFRATVKNEHRGFSLLVYGRVDFWVRHEFKLDWSWFLRQTQGTQDYQRKDTVHRLFPR